MGSSSRWTDFHKIWHGWRGPRRNHSLQFWLQYFQGFPIYRGSKFPFSHWLCWSSLQQCWRYRAACDYKTVQLQSDDSVYKEHGLKRLTATRRMAQSPRTVTAWRCLALVDGERSTGVAFRLQTRFVPIAHNYTAAAADAAVNDAIVMLVN